MEQRAARLASVAGPVMSRDDGQSEFAPLSLSLALVDAGTRLLMRGQQLTIRGVAAEAGVAPMTVCNQFGNKDELILAVAAEAFEDLADSLLANGGQDPLAALRAGRQRLSAMGCGIA